MAQRIFTLILLLCSTSVFAGLFDAPGRSQFVPADQAFAFDFQQNQHDLNLTWQIKDGYYLYRKQIRITPEHAKIADVQLPQGVWHEDEFYGKSEQFVPADQAFAFDFQQNQHDLNLTWQIKDGYYLYRKQIRITPEHAKIADVQLPQGVWHEDEFYGKSEIYRDRLTLPVTINQASAGAADASRNHQPGECGSDVNCHLPGLC